ncbi:MAG: phospholipid carrier-dependent glycosyltransferase [Elusimicrobiota bacterium]
MKGYLPPIYAAGLALAAFALVADAFGSALSAGIFAAGLLGVVLIGAAGSGRVLLRAFGVRDLSESERTLVGATLGLGLVSQLLFLLGSAGLWRPWAAIALLAMLWIVGAVELPALLKSLDADRRLLAERPAASAAVFLLLAMSCLAAFVPPHQYDALVYHLPLPAAYIRSGRIISVEHLVYTHFPQNAEMLYGLALLLGSDILAQLFSWACAVLSVGWVFEIGKRELPMPAVLLACILVCGHSAVLLLAPTAYVECPVMLWTTAAVFSFLRAREASHGEEGSPRAWWALSGIFCGLGVGTKYSAAITPLLLGAALFARWISMRAEKERGKDLAVFFGWAAAAGAPWLIKNLWTVGNPVFPFFYRWMPARGAEWTAGSAGRYFEMLKEYGHRGSFFSELVGFFLHAAAGSLRYGGGADLLGSIGWAPLLFSLPVALWAARKNGFLRASLGYSAGHWAAWFSTGVVLRFLLPIVPVLALPASAGLHLCWKESGKRVRMLLAAGGAALVVLNLGLFFYVHALFGSLSVLTGLKSRGAFLSEKLDYYPCARFAQERLPRNDRILLVGEQRGYYVVQPHTATSVMSPNRFVLAANEAADPKDLASRLSEDGTRWIIEVPREAQRLSGYGIFSWTGKGESNWAGLRGGLETVFQDPGRCEVLRLP